MTIPQKRITTHLTNLPPILHHHYLRSWKVILLSAYASKTKKPHNTITHKANNTDKIFLILSDQDKRTNPRKCAPIQTDKRPDPTIFKHYAATPSSISISNIVNSKIEINFNNHQSPLKQEYSTKSVLRQPNYSSLPKIEGEQNKFKIRRNSHDDKGKYGIHQA